jgi:hypothetical protein
MAGALITLSLRCRKTNQLSHHVEYLGAAQGRETAVESTAAPADIVDGILIIMASRV